MQSDLSNLMKKAQEMERKIQAAQEEIAKQELVGEAGAGLVKITMNGQYEVKKIELDNTIVPGLNAEDKEMLQDLIIAAINNANQKIKVSTKATIPGLPRGFDIAGLGNLFKGV